MINAKFLFIILFFYTVVGWTLASRERRRITFARSLSQWSIDVIGLTMHGLVVPLFQIAVVFAGLAWLAPSLQGALRIPAPAAFLLNFVAVDYLYYWNHRWLHRAGPWRLHALHHSGESFDVFTTSRNSLLSSFVILYVWVNGAFLFLLADPVPYAWGAALSSCLDILRHSRMESWPSSFPFNLVISPREHAWHHSRDLEGKNFGGNLNLWDRLHGTYYAEEKLPSEIGIPIDQNRLWSAFWKGAT